MSGQPLLNLQLPEGGSDLEGADDVDQHHGRGKGNDASRVCQREKDVILHVRISELVSLVTAGAENNCRRWP